jgi:spore maturation protein A
MLNHVFVILIILGVLVGLGYSIKEATEADTLGGRIEALKKRGNDITENTAAMAKLSVELCLGYIGMMALWLGIMKIADESGLVKSLIKLIRPVMTRLFPRVPPDHPAMGAMLMNMAANMLGLDNAATPLGLKAMKELQSLNAEKDTASNSMIMFLAINTSSITLVPFGVFVWRIAANSTDAQVILGPALLATTCSTIGGVTAAFLWAKYSKPTRDYCDEYLEGKDLSKLESSESNV